MTQTAFVALGTNMPWQGVSGPALLAQAVVAIADAGLAIRARSGVWQTVAWPPGSDQPDYFNAVVDLDPAGRTPDRLYDLLRRIETAFGRERRTRWEARTLDLDIAAMDKAVGVFGDLTLPHPRLQERAFVLAPLAEIAPNWRHPISDLSASALLARLSPSGYRRVGDLA